MAVTGFVLFVIAAACCTVVAKPTYDSNCPSMTTWGKAQQCCMKKGQNLPDRRNTSVIDKVKKDMDDRGLNSIWTIQREITAKRWIWLDGTIYRGAVQESSPTNSETDCAYFDLHRNSFSSANCLVPQLGHICRLENCTGCNMGRVAPFACVQEGATCYFHFCLQLTWPKAQAHCKSFRQVALDLPILNEQSQVTALASDKWHCSKFWVGMRKTDTFVIADQPGDSPSDIPHRCVQLEKNRYTLTSCDNSTAWVCVGDPAKNLEQTGDETSSNSGTTIVVVIVIVLLIVGALVTLLIFRKKLSRILHTNRKGEEEIGLCETTSEQQAWMHDRFYDVIFVSATEEEWDLGPSSALFIMEKLLTTVDKSLNTCVLNYDMAAFIKPNMVSNIIILFPENFKFLLNLIKVCPEKISNVITDSVENCIKLYPTKKAKDFIHYLKKAKVNFFVGSHILDNWERFSIDVASTNFELYVPIHGFVQLPRFDADPKHFSIIIDLIATKFSVKVGVILEKLNQFVLEKNSRATALVNKEGYRHLQHFANIDLRIISTKADTVDFKSNAIWFIISDTNELTWTMLQPSMYGIPQIVGDHTSMADELDGIPSNILEQVVVQSDRIEERCETILQKWNKMESCFQTLPMMFLSSPKIYRSQRKFLVHCLGTRIADLEIQLLKHEPSDINLEGMSMNLLSSLPIFPRKKGAEKDYLGKKIYDSITRDLGKVICAKRGNEENSIDLMVYLKDEKARGDFVESINSDKLGMALLKVFLLKKKDLLPNQDPEELGVEINVTFQEDASMDIVTKKTWLRNPLDGTSNILHKAAEAGAYEVVKNCVEDKRQYVDLKDKVVQGSFSNFPTCTRELVEKMYPNDGCTPLISAAMYGHKKVVGYLLNQKADPNQQDKYGRTALILAADATGIIMEPFEPDPFEPFTVDDEEETENNVEDENPEETAILLIENGAEVDKRDMEGETALVKAANKGYAGLAEALVDKGADVDIKNKEGETALMTAMKDGNENLIKILMNTNADVHTTDKNEQTLLMHASRRGDQSSMTELLKRNVDVDGADRTGRTALIFAATSGYDAAVAILIDANASVDHRDESGRTALIHAARSGHDNVVTVLLTRRASTEHTDEKGNTALSHAAETGQIHVVTILLDHNAFVEHKNHEGKTAEELAYERNHTEVANILRVRSTKPEAKIDTDTFEEAMDSGDIDALELILKESPKLLEEESEEGYTPLMRAVQSRQGAVLSQLLRKKANVNHVSSKNGWSAIHIAVYENDFLSLEKLLAGGNGADVNLESVHGFTPLMVAIVNRGYDMASELLRKGATLTYEAGEYGRTPLMYAVEGNDMKMANFLLDKGANIDHESEKKGYTPLLWAVALNSCGAVNSLIEVGAKVNRASSKTGRNALNLAAELGLCDIVTTLLGKGADKLSETIKGETALMLALNQCNNGMIDHLHDNKFDLEYKSKELGLNPLLYAIWQRLDLRHLISKGAQLGAHDEKTGFTPLIFAIKCGNKDAIGSLIDNGADIEQESAKTGKTPLMYAVEGEKSEIIDYLLKRGAKIDQTSKKTGLTPLLFALDNSPTRMVKLLLEKGANVESVAQKPGT